MSRKRTSRNSLSGLLVAVVVASASLAAAPEIGAADVLICDGAGNCYVFGGPPCSEWSLADDSECTDILAVTDTGFDRTRGENGEAILFAFHDGRVRALRLGRGAEIVGSLVLMDLRDRTVRHRVGVSGELRTERVPTPGRPIRRGLETRSILELTIIEMDPETSGVTDIRIESVDVTDLHVPRSF